MGDFSEIMKIEVTLKPFIFKHNTNNQWLLNSTGFVTC